MLRKICISVAVFLFLFSCEGKKKRVESTVVLKDTIVAVDIDIDIDIEDGPFDDFIYVFAGDTAFQRSRIVFPLPYYEEDTPLKIEKEDWMHDALFAKQNYYTLLLNNEAELDHPHGEVQTSVQIEWIFMKEHKVKRYYFERVGGRWMLKAISLHAIEKTKQVDFIDFFVRFAADSLYQLKHMRQPLKFVTTDPDDDFSIIETTLDTEQWFAFKPVLPDERLSNIIYGQEITNQSPYTIMQLKGVGNGFLNTLFFRKKTNGQWELYKFEDTSD